MQIKTMAAISNEVAYSTLIINIYRLGCQKVDKIFDGCCYDRLGNNKYCEFCDQMRKIDSKYCGKNFEPANLLTVLQLLSDTYILGCQNHTKCSKSTPLSIKYLDDKLQIDYGFRCEFCSKLSDLTYNYFDMHL